MRFLQRGFITRIGRDEESYLVEFWTNTDVHTYRIDARNIQSLVRWIGYEPRNDRYSPTIVLDVQDNYIIGWA